MLGVTRHTRVFETGLPGRLPGDLDCLGQSLDAGLAKALLDSKKKVTDPGLRRIGPFGLRDQVDLPTVQPLRNDTRLQASGGERRNRGLGGRVQRCLFFRRREASFDELEPLLAGQEYLRPSIDAEKEVPWTAWTGRQLAVDVLDVCPCDDVEIHREPTQCFDDAPEAFGVRPSIRYRRAVPVEDDRLEPAIESIR